MSHRKFRVVGRVVLGVCGIHGELVGTRLRGIWHGSKVSSTGVRGRRVDLGREGREREEKRRGREGRTEGK